MLTSFQMRTFESNWRVKVDEILTNPELTDHDKNYFYFHIRRYKFLLESMLRLQSQGNFSQILDIGPSFQTLLIKKFFPLSKLDVLGFPLPKFTSDTRNIFHFDLNQTFYKEIAPPQELLFQKYDAIAFCEVIEHLHTNPVSTLSFLNSLLSPSGILIIQTPNAAFLGNRLKLLIGVNPYQVIRAEKNNPGHFREYTKKELITMLEVTGFNVVSMTGKNYFGHEGIAKKTFNVLVTLMPSTFQAGFTLIAKKK